MAARHKSIETKFMEQRETALKALRHLDRRSFLKVAGATMGAVLAKGLITPHSFQLVTIADAATDKSFGSKSEQGSPPFSFAYISDSHLYERTLNQRFVRAALKAVEDVNALDPQPDFVLFGGDLAQLGRSAELELGKQILNEVKAPVKMMVGEHDWFFDMGDKWQELFGPPNYSFDWKGVHVVVLMSVHEKDFWTARGMTPEQRMQTVAGLDNGVQSRFEVGEEERKWMADDLAKVPHDTPIIVFSHSPLYKYYRNWNFWTEDAEQVQAILKPFQKVTVFHGHTHQMLFNQIGNISFYGMLSTAWPWPYAPEGLPKLTIQMNRADPFDQFDGCGDGRATVRADGLADKLYNLWDRNPVTVKADYLTSHGKVDRPPTTQFASY
jgi:predicted phosphodiesterase